MTSSATSPGKWTAADIPDLTGLRAIVTGANSGLGLVTALELARHGASVTMACRDEVKGSAALKTVQQAASEAATVSLAALDLASLESVREFSANWQANNAGGLDILVNNAGVMALPKRETTVDGFERQLGTNHLGHFALTGLLMPALEQRPGARVVSVSSNAHKFGSMHFDDLMSEQKYGSWRAYGQSKLANLLFMLELARRVDLAKIALISVAAHPGLSDTNLVVNGPASRTSAMASVINTATSFTTKLMAQSATMGALPQLYAATAPGVPSGSYIGPDGLGEQKGYPKVVKPTKAAQDTEAARTLWNTSEELTGVSYLD
jgi:hypothetical protein